MPRRRKKRMVIRYEPAPGLQKTAEDICARIFPNVQIDKVKYFRSYGSTSRNCLARCHGLAKIMQEAMECPAYYAIEFITEKFDRLPKEEQIKTIIHELMHIPRNFGGGFKHHGFVTEKAVNRMHEQYKRITFKSGSS